jgi:hypothetical protein
MPVVGLTRNSASGTRPEPMANKDDKDTTDQKAPEAGMTTSQRLKKLAQQGTSLDVNDLDNVAGGMARVMDGGGMSSSTLMCGW